MDSPLTTQIYPVKDSKAHVLEGVDCWCKPAVEYRGIERIVVHNSAAGRETYERGERKKH